MSTLGYAILGLLAAQPQTGYDLARLMRTPIGYMWTARHSQIYPELARLEGERLVTATVIDGPGPRDTKRYEITPAGWHALQDFLEGDAIDDPTSFVFAEYATLRSGLMHVQVTIAWLDWLLGRLEAVQPQAGVAVDEADPAQHPD